jgi:hypothetical protein
MPVRLVWDHDLDFPVKRLRVRPVAAIPANAPDWIALSWLTCSLGSASRANMQSDGSDGAQLSDKAGSGLWQRSEFLHRVEGL